jgi:hypothetical protein
MAGQRATPASRSRLFRVLNPIMRFVLLHSPLRPRRGRLLVLSFTGRRSGREYAVPVSYTVDSDGSLLVPGGGAWKSNLEGGRPVHAWLAGRDVRAIAEVITERAEIARLLPTLASASPIIDRFIGVRLHDDGRPDAADLEEALDDGFAIVRLRLDEQGGGR